jgi:TolB-like protein/Flp pilus assembly protein TadD
MKRCPECKRDYYDETLLYCLDDGTPLLDGPAASGAEGPPTQILPGEAPTRAQIHSTDATAPPAAKKFNKKLIIIPAVAVVLIIGGFFGYRYLSGTGGTKQIASIAVMPFVNESGNPDLEYLSDGMTETLIGKLTRLENLKVKARSTVFHYKGQAVDPKAIGQELGVEAILLGRVIARGDQITLGLELVNVKTGDQIWSEQYVRSQPDIIKLQTEVAVDVSKSLRAKLSGTEVPGLSKDYTQNAEAYQLYLRGRYHMLKTTRVDIEKGISYFQQAIQIDPSYALAYSGLADAYRSLGLSGERPPSDVMPKAKAAAQKAIDLDDKLADAHANLGFIIYWFDRNFGSAQQELERAIELDPENSSAHIYYAHVLITIGKKEQALAAAQRASELEPLNLRNNALASQHYTFAGQFDEALVQAKKVTDLDPDYWLGHHMAAMAYCEKGMFDEAIAEAKRGSELNEFSSAPRGLLGYALAKAGRRVEAEAIITTLLKQSQTDYASPYNIALIYNGLNRTHEALDWLERGMESRDPRLVWLSVDPKWNNLRTDPRYLTLLRRLGLPE